MRRKDTKSNREVSDSTIKLHYQQYRRPHWFVTQSKNAWGWLVRKKTSHLIKKWLFARISSSYWFLCLLPDYLGRYHKKPSLTVTWSRTPWWECLQCLHTSTLHGYIGHLFESPIQESPNGSRHDEHMYFEMLKVLIWTLLSHLYRGGFIDDWFLWWLWRSG